MPVVTTSPRIAILVPCYNEAAAVTQVVRDFQHALPGSTVYVYDNNSTDDTAAVARAAGAVVRTEPLQGKGQVVRRMFADIEADVYVMVDGDATYDAASAPAMVRRLLDEGYDMITGARQAVAQEAYRPGHRFGNRLLTGLVVWAFGRSFEDMLSGYRVMSRRFVKSFPAMARGFETETELTVHALEIRAAIAEMPTPYFARPEGSQSKLSTYRDGVRILRTIGTLVKEERPLAFFSVLALIFLLAGLAIGLPVVWEYSHTGLVPRLPSAVLAAALSIQSLLLLSVGLVLDSLSAARREQRRFRYLDLPSPATVPAATQTPP